MGHFSTCGAVTSPQSTLMMSRTPWDLNGTSNGGRSFTKSMHRKSALQFGISNSNLAVVIIGPQRSRKAKNKKKSKFRLSSILIIQISK